MPELNVNELSNSNQDFFREISKIKKQLNVICEKKEFWFKKKEDLKVDIRNQIQQIKAIKLKTDESNISIQDMKKERDKYNDQVSYLIKEIDKLNKEKKEVFEKYKITEDPYKVQKHIEDIERKLETETSFENEKKLMKRLNALKSIYKESKIKDLIEHIDKLNKQLRESKKKSYEFHKKIVSTAADTNGYAVFVDLSRKINSLRTEQEQAFNKFIEFKKEFLKTNDSLKTLLKQSSEVGSKLNKIKHVEHAKKEETIRQLLREKTQSVLEKFRKKKRLDTNDIIVLQAEQK